MKAGEDLGEPESLLLTHLRRSNMVAHARKILKSNFFDSEETKYLLRHMADELERITLAEQEEQDGN